MKVRQDGLVHARLVQSAMRGQLGSMEVTDDIRNSWNRCLTHYSLDPAQVKKPQIIDHIELKQRRERLGPLLQIASVEMMGLSRQMLQSHFGVMLTDSDGVILSYVGDSGFADTAKRGGFREGAVWSERELGTNGMGTCLMTKRPIVIHRTEHFLVQNTGLTCSATPIFDAQGRLLAALDVSGYAEEVQTHTRALLEIAAQNIENRALLDRCRSQFLLRFHRIPQFVTTPGEGVLAFDALGIVTGVNRNALELLDGSDHASLCGQRVDQLLETPLATLMQLASRPTLRPEMLGLHRGHLCLYGIVHSPAPEIRFGNSTPAAVVAEIGDPVIASNNQIARRVMNRDISILLLGETGTGKGFFAKSIHSASQRAEKPFVSVNCAAIPESLIESELFGYLPGAFTGATRQGHVGRIVQADGGTLFLDEIGDMPLSLQARLLSVIEDREVLPLGGSHPVRVDIHIISATHRDLIEMIARGQFRDDLYYRLNGITLTMPPLRRREDRSDLLRRLLVIEAGERKNVSIDDALLKRLAAHDWPGNVRQVRNVLRTMLALSESDHLMLRDFDENWLSGVGVASQPAVHAAPAASTPIAVISEADADNVLGSAECDAMRRTLEACHWNVSLAAERLNVSRKTMYRKMHRHGLTRQAAIAESRTSAAEPASAVRDADAALSFSRLGYTRG